MSDLLPENPPTPENGYEVSSLMEMTPALFNSIFSSIHERLAAREDLEADFEALIDEGTSAALTMVQENIAPQLVALKEDIEASQEAIDEMLAGTAPNASKLGDQPPTYYLNPANFSVSGDIKALLQAEDAEAARDELGVTQAISDAIDALMNGAPGALDTLKELADALGSDPNFATTVTNALAGKLGITGGTMTGDIDMGGHTILNAVGDFLPIGAVLFDPRGIGWPGFLEANGSSFDTDVYPDLAALYPSGVLPDFTDRVPRGAGTLAGAAGTYQNDAMQRITGEVERGSSAGLIDDAPSLTSGAFVPGSKTFSNGIGGRSVTAKSIGFDSGNSPGARVSDDETRVKAIVGKWYIKAYGAFNNTGEADLVAIEQAQVQMLRKDVQTLSSGEKAQVHANLDTAAEIGKLALGVDQTWQDVKASRSVNTSYQNTGSVPICVSINGTSSVINLSVDGSTWLVVSNGTSGSPGGSGFAVIPPGQYYRVTGGTPWTWTELR